MSASDRQQLSNLLVARGFPPADADGFVAGLGDSQVTADLAWHRAEEGWLSEPGAPSSWGTERRLEVWRHYAGPSHRVPPLVLARMARQLELDQRAIDAASAPPPAGDSAGLVLLVGGAAAAAALGLMLLFRGRR